MTDEERFIEAKRLGDIKTAQEARAHELKWAPLGGTGKRSCLNCRFKSAENCLNAAAKLKGMQIERVGIRSDSGLCGPNGLFFARRPYVKTETLIITGIIASLLALIGVLFYFFGWVVFVCLGVLILIFAIGNA